MITPYFTTADGRVTLYQGDAREVLQSLPAESIQCVVTSPPYWGLRDYGIPPIIWGGDPGCEHRYGDPLISRATRSDEFQSWANHARDGLAPPTAPHLERSQGSFCTRCGAWRGSLGLEPTPEHYVAHLIEVFREIKRVLKTTGTIWLNVGDTMYGGAGHRAGETNSGKESYTKDTGAYATFDKSGPHPVLKPLDLVGIPWRLAFALQADGWYLRSGVIWYKDNPMPESIDGWRWEKHRVKVAPSRRAEADSAHSLAYGDRPQGARDGREFADHASEYADCPGCPKCQAHSGLVLRQGSWRPTSTHEHLFMLTKAPQYFANAEAVREQGTSGPSDLRKMAQSLPRLGGKHKDLDDPLSKASSDTNIGQRRAVGSPLRNRRDVWQIATRPFPGAHFATFPEDLVRPCILASTSEAGECPLCGMPWSPVVDRKFMVTRHGPRQGEYGVRTTDGLTGTMLERPESTILSWSPSCSCTETKS